MIQDKIRNAFYNSTTDFLENLLIPLRHLSNLIQRILNVGGEIYAQT
jgi:hypothetical protein